MMKVKFWIKSSRGTDKEAIFTVPRYITHTDTVKHFRYRGESVADCKKRLIDGQLEQWCEQFGAWHHGDNYVNYGWNITRTNKPAPLFREAAGIYCAENGESCMVCGEKREHFQVEKKKPGIQYRTQETQERKVTCTCGAEWVEVFEMSNIRMLKDRIVK
jgi:hypothetical protein